MTKFGTATSVSVKSEQLKKAALIFKYTHKSATSLLAAFDDAKARRGNPRGVLTDQEQDILRASLVMCCAGLDAALKQSIRDSLEYLLSGSETVRDGFQKFIQKRLGSDEEVWGLGSGVKFLAAILAARDTRRSLIEEYIKELTGESLQSAEQVMSTTAALGVDHKAMGIDVKRLKDIFGIRNKIIHELDISLAANQRKRRVRSQADLLDNSDFVLGVTRRIIAELDQVL